MGMFGRCTICQAAMCFSLLMSENSFPKNHVRWKNLISWALLSVVSQMIIHLFIVYILYIHFLTMVHLFILNTSFVLNQKTFLARNFSMKLKKNCFKLQYHGWLQQIQ
jgi:hypothetical protein